MPRVTDAVEVPHAPADLYALVSDLERFPEFLPWLERVEATARRGDEVLCRVAARHDGLAIDLSARVRLDPGRGMAIRATGWWFRRLESRWSLVPLPGGGTRVAHELDYDLAVPVLALAARPLIARGTPKVIARFVARADALYGPSPS